MTTTATKTLNIRIPNEQYEELEEIVKVRHYTSKAEYIRELLRHAMDEYTGLLHEKADMDKEKHVPLEEYGKSRGLE
jgi:Arc/MetJ-type ribon-helix-helix transcriptional regulator